MTDSIRFLLGDERRELRDIDPTMTVLNYLRQVERRCGTKEGCAEGDCGACTVVLGEPAGERIRYRAVNSCIQFVPTLDGKQLIAVEQLKDADGSLHPVQQAMVDAHGSQCGFCTPGFVMSLFALFHEGTPKGRDKINDALAGNLCRCTGYGPIVAAAEHLCRGSSHDRFAAAEAATLAALRELRNGEPAAASTASGHYFAPTRVEELVRLVGAQPAATLLAGGTDVGLWVTKQHRRLDPVIYVGNVLELGQVDVTSSHIDIGAAVTYADLHELIARHYPDFGELIRRLGSVQIRNVGTMGGNIANGSPIGDGPPPLIALGTTLVLRSAAGRRELPLEDYFITYGKQDRQPGEFVELIRLPLPRAGWHFHCYKISKRFDQDITAALGAFNIKLDNGIVTDVRIAFGGMAPTPKRAMACEAALKGKSWTRATVAAGQQALRQDFAPITDVRASKGYRARIAENLLLKFFIETTEADTETRVVGKRGRVHG